MDKKAVKALLEKYKQGVANDEEKLLLENWYLKYHDPDESELSIDDRLADLNAVYAKLESDQHPVKRLHIRPYIAAASVLLLVCVGLYFALHNNTPVLQETHVNKQSIQPGGNKATLTLANGEKIILTTAKNGNLTRQGKTLIKKIAEDEVVYRSNISDKSRSAIQYNTMTTPRGGQYHIVLADGTTVWLNAASSIKFPTAFYGKTREVELTGEAYFEVAHDSAKPFRVKCNGQLVEVLGTHFNINAYADEPLTTTTLLQGSVRISRNGANALLKPGQSAIIREDKPQIAVQEADTEQAIAWKNGFFEFQKANIKTVMRQLERWYNVEVEYRGAIPAIDFSGEIERNLTMAEVLELLRHTHLHFTIEGTKIIIVPDK